MIKKTMLLLPVILYIALLQAQQSTNNNQQLVQRTVVKFFDALSNRDSVSLKAYSTRDITLYEYGQV